MGNSSVKFQLISIDINGISINIPSKLPEEAEFDFLLTIEHIINRKESTIAVNCMVIVKIKTEEEPLCVLRDTCTFFIDNLNKYYIEDTNRYHLEEDFISILNSVTISTTRGILYSTLRGTPFQNAILPIIDPKSMIKETKVKT